MKNFTFVTALYDIGREKHDGRSYKTYQLYFKKILSIPVNMVIYTEKCNEILVNEIRKNLPTKLIITDINDIPFYYTRNDVENIIKNTDFKKKILHPNGLENRFYNYIPLVNSKFIWIQKAIENNYFNTEMTFWIDAGLSRFLNFDISLDNYNYNLINKIKDKIYIQIGRYDKLFELFNNDILLDEIIGKNINYIMAGFFGGNNNLMNEICNIGKNMFINEFINKLRVDNEQVIMGFILKKYVNNLILVKNQNDMPYINYYIFCNMANQDIL